jgi:leucyl aminopeptidase (aminopeptidase T)
MCNRKKHAYKKAAEIEECRKQEEAARLAILNEQEEQQHHLQAERKKKRAEAERQHLERSAVEKEAAHLREQQTAMKAQMQAKFVKDKQTNEKSETKVKAALNRAAILDRTFNMPTAGSSVDKHNGPTKNVNVDDYVKLTYWESPARMKIGHSRYLSGNVERNIWRP